MNQEKSESPLDQALERPSSRFVVGIDLGTTNSAVAYVDTLSSSRKVETFQVEQLVDWSLVERRDTLPSFHYQLTSMEKGTVQHKWIQKEGVKNYVVGVLARDRGLQMPGRQIASAKSWLCHPGVDRTAPMLPWNGDEDVELLSPVAASASYLQQIRTDWNAQHRNDLLEDQDVVITLPASFDEVARELTIEAAKIAGLPRVLLLEEPQAAFYAWLQRHGDDWSSKIKIGQSILVCDIGGGTTDLTLIRVKSSKHNEGPRNTIADVGPDKGKKLEHDIQSEQQRLHRVAVGQHLILGGDNLDLALAKGAESKMLGKGQLPSRDWDALRLHCRVAKETLLGNQPPAEYVVTLSGTGSKILSQSRSVTIDRKMVQELLLDGFFPMVDLQDRPKANASGFQEFGLPYAQDAAITRHLASFLWDHRLAGRDESEQSSLTDIEAARPDFILFNGGVLESDQIRKRILSQIESWFESTPLPKNGSSDEAENQRWSLQELQGNRLDLAVAHGAAYFGLVRRGEGIRIDASLARTYYLQVSDEPPKAICLVPGDTQAGDRIRLAEHPFELMLGQPVQFPLWVSSIRLTDRSGAIVEIDTDQMKPMPPIRTVLESSKHRRAEVVPVVIEAELTEIGTLNLSCRMQDNTERWKLDFDVRSAMETDRVAHSGEGELSGIVAQGTLEVAFEVLRRAFGPTPSLDPKEVVRTLVEATQLPRNEWPPSLLRGMWSQLIELEEGRRTSAHHEARWLNLVGYFLRPGYGYAADDWRVATTWRKVQGKLRHRSVTNASEAIILWRRIAGGFTAGQQQALYQEIAPRLKSLFTQDSRSSVGVPTNEAMELLRLAGSLELLPATERGQLAKWILASFSRKKMAPLTSAMLWTLGRIGSRVPMYGPLHQLMQPSQVESWMETLLTLDAPSSERAFALMQLARKTGDRYRDVSDSCRTKVLAWMEANNIGESTQSLVREVGELTSEQKSTMLGEAIPFGLQIR